MTATTYARLAGTIFAIVALAHAARVLMATPVTLGDLAVPMAVSWIGIAVTGALAVLGFRAGR
jgi:hypothetical protein